jgi:hypothetical protein
MLDTDTCRGAVPRNILVLPNEAWRTGCCPGPAQHLLAPRRQRSKVGDTCRNHPHQVAPTHQQGAGLPASPCPLTAVHVLSTTSAGQTQEPQPVERSNTTVVPSNKVFGGCRLESVCCDLWHMGPIGLGNGVVHYGTALYSTVPCQFVLPVSQAMTVWLGFSSLPWFPVSHLCPTPLHSREPSVYHSKASV